MFGTFRKHSTWLWSIIIGATAVSMVIYFGPGNRSAADAMGGGNRLGSISGEPVTMEDLQNAAKEARLQYFVTRQEWPGNEASRMGFDLNKEAYVRLFMIRKQEELGIHIGDEQVAKVVANDLHSMSRNGAVVTVQMFEDSLLKPQGLTLADYQRFIRHELGMGQLRNAVTAGGRLVTEKEARTIFERENRERSVQAVFFSATNYSKITPVESDLRSFYSNYVASYRLPERIQVDYVEFKATNFWDAAAKEMAKLTNLTAILDGEYARRGTNFYREMTPEQAKESIKQELHEQLALREASKVANAFADPILSAEVIRAEALTERAKEQGVEVKESAPFAQNSTPAGMNVSEPFVKAAFSLHEDEPVRGPIVDGDAIYVLARSKVLPSELQSYEQVQNRVLNDYLQAEALKAARDAASDFAAKATNAVAEGKAFTSVCSEAKVKPVLLPPFSLTTRSLSEVEQHMSLQQFKQIAFNFQVGKVSPAVPIMGGAVVAYIQSELPLDEKKVTEQFPAFMEMFRQARQQEAFEEWFNHEAPVALANTPVAGPRPSELEQPGAAN